MGSWTVWTKLYFSGSDKKNPLLSPLFGNFEGIPPLIKNGWQDIARIYEAEIATNSTDFIPFRILVHLVQIR
jgi:hypothetical protein